MSYTPTTEEVRNIEDLSEGQCEAGVMVKGVWHRCVQSIRHKGWSHRNPDAEIVWMTDE